MGHSALPILMAVLSCCVWENVEVRATQPGSFVMMAHCFFFAVCLAECQCDFWIFFLKKRDILLHIDITHATQRVAAVPCLHIADTQPYLGQV